MIKLLLAAMLAAGLSRSPAEPLLRPIEPPTPYEFGDLTRDWPLQFWGGDLSGLIEDIRRDPELREELRQHFKRQEEDLRRYWKEREKTEREIDRWRREYRERRDKQQP